MQSIIWIFGLDFVVNVFAEAVSIFDGEVDNDVEIDGFFGFIEIEAMHFEDTLVRKNYFANVFLDFGDGFVFGVDGVDTDGVEDDAVFFEDVFGDATRDLI